MYYTRAQAKYLPYLKGTQIAALWLVEEIGMLIELTGRERFRWNFGAYYFWVQCFPWRESWKFGMHVVIEKLRYFLLMPLKCLFTYDSWGSSYKKNSSFELTITLLQPPPTHVFPAHHRQTSWLFSKFVLLPETPPFPKGRAKEHLILYRGLQILVY